MMRAGAGTGSGSAASGMEGGAGSSRRDRDSIQPCAGTAPKAAQSATVTNESARRSQSIGAMNSAEMAGGEWRTTGNAQVKSSMAVTAVPTAPLTARPALWRDSAEFFYRCPGITSPRIRGFPCMADKKQLARIRQAEKQLMQARRRVDEQVQAIHRLEALGHDDGKAQHTLEALLEALEAAQQGLKAARGAG